MGRGNDSYGNEGEGNDLDNVSNDDELDEPNDTCDIFDEEKKRRKI